MKSSGQPVGPIRTSGGRGRVSFEIIGHQLTFDMQYPVVTCKPNTSWLYMCAEPLWVRDGSARLNHFPEIARIQAPYSDNGVSLHGAYGPHYRFQRRWLINRLNSDRNTRQAYISIWRRNPPYLRDIACTTGVQWLIRENAIHCVVTMRSSDVGMGLPYDMLTFACMTADLASNLKESTELGCCTITAGSRHIYEDQWDRLDPNEMQLRQYRYEPWATWKWPAIEQVMRGIAGVDVIEVHRSDAQARAFKALMEASGGKA